MLVKNYILMKQLLVLIVKILIYSTVSDTLLFAAAGASSAFVLPAIGDAFEGGFFAGLISHTANGVATHALIVAPRATGASGTGYTIGSQLGWATNGTIGGATSTFDGRANTDAFIAQGISNYPAAQFCTTLSIGGYTDWYLPALLELQIAYFNLKPTNNPNVTLATAGVSAGINAYSVPPRTSDYTSGNPTITTVAAFQSTGSEPFTTGQHWTSSGASSPNIWVINFGQGEQSSGHIVFNSFSVRAFRRIAL